MPLVTPAPHDVYVVPDPAGFKVRPPVAVSRPNNLFRMRNLTHNPLVVRFPEGLMTTLSGNIGAQSSGEFTVASHANGVYDYSVEVDVKGVKLQAIGESGPRIIIDP